MSRTKGKVISVGRPTRARPRVAGSKLVDVPHPHAIGKIRVHPADVELYETAAADKPEANKPTKAKRARRKPANKAAANDTANKAEDTTEETDADETAEATNE